MPAPTHPRTHPVTTGRVDIRLPWWALALPVLAFVALLALIVDPSHAHATAGDPALTHVVERIQEAVRR
ncbi:hypothetical protein [Streptomyces sp. NPDC054842]